MNIAPTLGACLIVRDEATRLPDCLQSLAGFDALYVVDTGSTDDTVAIAKAYGAQVGSFPWRHDFAAARNAALSLATTDWVLVIDADERLSAGALTSLRAIIADPAAHGRMLAPVIHNEHHLGASSTLHRVDRLFQPSAKDQLRRRFVGQIHESLREADGSPVTRSLVDGWHLIHTGYQDLNRMRLAKGERNLTLLQQWVVMEPDNPQACYCFGQELAVYGRYPEALAWLQRALALVSDPADRNLACLQLLFTLSAMGDPEGVLTVGTAHPELGAAFPDYWLIMGYAAVLLQQLDDAKGYFARAQTLDPALPVVHETDGARTWKPRAYLAQVALMELDWPHGYQEAKALMAEQGDKAVVQLLFVRAAMAMGDDGAVAELCQKLLDRWPVSAGLADKLASLLEEFGGRGQRLLEPFIGWPGGFLPVARRLSAAGQLDLVLTLCDRWVTVIGAEAWAIAGSALVRLDRLEEALRAFDEACTLEPGDWENWHQLGLVAMQLGDREAATVACQEALRRHPGALAAMITLLDLAAMVGDFPQASVLLAQARQMAPNHPEVTQRATMLAAFGIQ
ncbi:MAG: glycosyltransferase [Candidatus Sericytochromatia bacterium]|nr:glycosyltransferase [Candidatus Sericytochromatia bacterium]